MAKHEPSSRPGISRARLAHIAAWSIDLHPDEADRTCVGIVRKTYACGVRICPRDMLLESWMGVVTGFIKTGTVSPEGCSVTFTGVPASGWFGKGTVLKNEPRRYDIAASRDTRIAFMDRVIFIWLVENSVAFNHFLAKQLNERFGYFMALLEYDRLLDVTPRLAHCTASLFNPVFYPGAGDHLEITQEELDLFSGTTCQATNQSLRTLEEDGVVRPEYDSVTVVDLNRLRSHGA